MRNLIYGLVDPRTLLVRYIGLSATGLVRPKVHRRPSEMRRHNYKVSWIKSLLAAGLDYEIAVLEEVASKHALADTERFWIAYGRASGWPLTNLTDGGDGRIGHVPDASTRARMSAALRGKPKSAATRLKMSAWQIGRTVSPEARGKIAAALRGRSLPDATRSKMSAVRTGKKFTAETRAKMSAAMAASHKRRRRP